jgi:outer membrane protein assembly factor BamB
LIGENGRIYFVGNSSESGESETRLYVLDADTGSVLNNITPTPEAIPVETPSEGPPKIGIGTTVTGTPLLGADETLYVPFADGRLSRFEDDEEEPLTEAFIGSFLSSSPGIADDGTVYLGSLANQFAGVCPNGIPKFIKVVAPTQSSAAVIDGVSTEDRRIIVAGNDANVIALDYRSRQLWISFTLAPVRASVVVDRRDLYPDETADRVYVADGAGWVFALEVANGQQIWTRRPGAGHAISATPALGTEVLYVADEGGTLYAMKLETGEVVWACTAGGPVRSSPAVASSDQAETIVFGADDATVYAVDGMRASESCSSTSPDSCDCGDVSEWTVTLDASVGRASPAIDFEGTVYIGTEGGRLYAIGAPVGTLSPTGSPTPTPTPELVSTPTATPSETP